MSTTQSEAYQFIRVEAYSSTQRWAKTSHGRPDRGHKKWSAKGVLDEASRVPSASRHIDNQPPQPPIWLVGSRKAVEDAGEAWRKVTHVGTRKARSDSPWLAAGVVSLPRGMQSVWEDFRKQVVTWLQRRYKRYLRAVVQHLDEEHPHLHFYVVPEPNESFGVVHEGYRAREEGRKCGHPGRFYVDAMRKYQDDFQNEFAWLFALNRLGPRCPRLTRKDWRKKKVFEAEDAREEALAARAIAIALENEAKAKARELEQATRRALGSSRFHLNEVMKVRDEYARLRRELQSVIEADRMRAQEADNRFQTLLQQQPELEKQVSRMNISQGTKLAPTASTSPDAINRTPPTPNPVEAENKPEEKGCNSSMSPRRPRM